MTRTFMSENSRKDKLFNEWDKYIQKIHRQFSRNEFEKIFEGLTTVLEVSKDTITIQTDDKKMFKIPVNSEISSKCLRRDLIYLVLGKRKGKWWPLEVVSMGSKINQPESGAHVSFNPHIMNNLRGLNKMSRLVH